jgi:hypothetical protein
MKKQIAEKNNRKTHLPEGSLSKKHVDEYKEKYGTSAVISPNLFGGVTIYWCENKK